MAVKRRYSWIFLLSAAVLAVLVLVALLLSSSDTVKAKAIERDFAAMEKEIDSIELELTFHSDTRVAYKKQAELLYDLGIGGVPLLLQKVSEAESFSLREAFYMDGVFALLAVDRLTVYLAYGDKEDTDGELVKKLLLDSKTRIPAILTSDSTTKEKIKQLSIFGVLTVPYLQKESLTEEFADYFTAVNLHLTPAQRTDLQLGKMVPEDEEATLKAAFDCQKWLSDNKCDLTLLQNYVDGLTG